MVQIKGVGHVGIHVRNLRRSVDFYQKLVGLLPVVEEDSFHAFDVGGVHFCITQGRPKKWVGFDFVTDDVRALHQKLGEVGVDVSKITKESHSGHEGFYFVDPDGHRVQVWSAHE